MIVKSSAVNFVFDITSKLKGGASFVKLSRPDVQPPDFERELKSIHDAFDLQVVFSGSSALHLEHRQADLSRLAVMYAMSGLPCREYLDLQTGEPFAV